jgi:hypothetical protein
MFDAMEVGSLTPEDLKEFEVSVEDTGTVEKEDKSEDKSEEKEVKKIVDKGGDVSSLDDDFLKELEEEKEEGDKETTEDKKEVSKKSTEEKSKSKEKLALDYNAVYQNYVKKGSWVPVTDEDGNEVEIADEETFVKLMDWQVKNAAENALKEREEEFGQQYQTLVNHLKNGGRIEDLANTYEQERNIEDIDTSDEKGAENIIEAYYESLGWDKTEIKDQIETLKDKGLDYFSNFAEKRKTDLKKSIDAEREEIVAQQEEAARRMREHQETYNKNLKKLIHSQDVPEREKKELEKFYYDLKNPVNGKKASDFYIKFEEARQDPAKWIKVIQFFQDIDSFDKKSKVENKVTASIFKKVRTGESIKDSQTPEAVENKERKSPPSTFKRMFN